MYAFVLYSIGTGPPPPPVPRRVVLHSDAMRAILTVLRIAMPTVRRAACGLRAWGVGHGASGVGCPPLRSPACALSPAKESLVRIPAPARTPAPNRHRDDDRGTDPALLKYLVYGRASLLSLALLYCSHPPLPLLDTDTPYTPYTPYTPHTPYIHAYAPTHTDILSFSPFRLLFSPSRLLPRSPPLPTRPPWFALDGQAHRTHQRPPSTKARRALSPCCSSLPDPSSLPPRPSNWVDSKSSVQVASAQ